MKYIKEFRDGKKAKILAEQIKKEVKQNYAFMEFCGGHTHAIFKYGLTDLLPPEIKMIHGPGCPVCILPEKVIKQAIDLTLDRDILFCSYGDLLKVPGPKGDSLLKAKARGANVSMVYSSLDALNLARKNPDKKIVFMGIGFETTAPATAMAIKMAKDQNLTNFFVFCNHVLTPSAIQNIFHSPELRNMQELKIDGLLGPSHVSSIIGTRPYEYFTEEFEKPVVIAGFEPLDVLQSILMLVRQVNEKRAEVENQYIRVVDKEGNQTAKNIVAEIFELERNFEWRGLGSIPYSSLKIKKKYKQFDIKAYVKLSEEKVLGHKACQCGAILRGVKTALDCKLFGKTCTPENPLGPCMVSAEGACGAYYHWYINKKVENGKRDKTMSLGHD
ncbi:MAG: hydrogenase formation protein HypD [Epsilonproteobacteria bacterium]|nr:MAG: hydrogenase formation protein HypD [Campylobacterota bacterium]RLA66343.1 MAG: hydrogenase formation protein HypD [Campylobacterota bacterium]